MYSTGIFAHLQGLEKYNQGLCVHVCVLDALKFNTCMKIYGFLVCHERQRAEDLTVNGVQVTQFGTAVSYRCNTKVGGIYYHLASNSKVELRKTQLQAKYNS